MEVNFERLEKTKPLRILLQFGIPTIIGMLATSLIVIVDGIFIGHYIGPIGLASVNLTVPILYLFMGVTTMIHTGGIAIAARKLGEKDTLYASTIFTKMIILNVIAIFFLQLILILFIDNFVILLGGKEELFASTKEYLYIMAFFYIAMMLNIAFAMYIRGEGKPALSMAFGIAGNILNIILDYLFIGVFKWGLTGAALASGISVVIPMLLGFIYFATGKSTFNFVKFRTFFKDVKSILLNGFSEFIGMMSVCITTYIFNLVFLNWCGSTGVAAYTIAGYISLIESMILMGMAYGISPVFSYFWGASDSPPIFSLLKSGIVASFIIGIVCFIFPFFNSYKIASVFTSDESVRQFTSNGIKIICVSYVLNGFNILLSAFFTALGDAKKSAIISALRGLILINLLVLTLPFVWGVTGIWSSLPLTEIITFSVAVFLLVNKYSNIKRQNSDLATLTS